jgi:hypothetical protein
MASSSTFTKQQKVARTGHIDHAVCCVNQRSNCSSATREFVFKADVGLIQSMRDLSSSFGKFHCGSGRFLRSLLHDSGHLCQLFEAADSADDDGGNILWGGSVAAALILQGHDAFRTADTSNAAVLAAAREALQKPQTEKGALLEMGAGHALPSAVAHLNGATVLATDRINHIPNVTESLAVWH